MLPGKAAKRNSKNKCVFTLLFKIDQLKTRYICKTEGEEQSGVTGVGLGMVHGKINFIDINSA